MKGLVNFPNQIHKVSQLQRIPKLWRYEAAPFLIQDAFNLSDGRYDVQRKFLKFIDRLEPFGKYELVEIIPCVETFERLSFHFVRKGSAFDEGVILFLWVKIVTGLKNEGKAVQQF